MKPLLLTCRQNLDQSIVVIATVVAVVTAGVGVGCRPSGPAVQFVEGTMLLDGKPVEGVTVGFSPDGGGMPAYGRTNQDGVFRITTVQGGRPQGGAMVGTYTVTAQKWRNRLEELGSEPDRADAAAHAKWKAQYDELQNLPPEYIVPKAYGDKATSGIKADVKPGRNVGAEFQFQLKSDFKGS
jgi:hypothetical protein